MAKYYLTHKAVDDISGIWNYTYEVWSENQADRYYELLMHACREISHSPDIGKKYNEVKKGVLGFRVIKHIIFYRKITSNEIEILRILHEQMDLKNKLDE
jgi:toxin ParE1/3/4